MTGQSVDSGQALTQRHHQVPVRLISSPDARKTWQHIRFRAMARRRNADMNRI